MCCFHDIGAVSKKRLAVIPPDHSTRSSSFPNLMGTAQDQLAAFNNARPPQEAQEEGTDREGDVQSPSLAQGVEKDKVSPLPSPIQAITRDRDLSLPVGRTRNSEASRRRAFTLTGGVVR